MLNRREGEGWGEVKHERREEVPEKKKDRFGRFPRCFPCMTQTTEVCVSNPGVTLILPDT